MRAVVIYEGMNDNTHQAAEAIGSGLAEGFDVTIVPIVGVGQDMIGDTDLVVVGGSEGNGLVDWLSGLSKDHHHTRAAAFETRLNAPTRFTGRASKGLTRLLRVHAFDMIARPESFLVTKQDRLQPEETTRARAWGSRLAAGIAASPSQSTRRYAPGR